MRLLVIALRSPFSGHSGNALILRNYLAHLAPRHELHLAMVGNARDREHPDLARWCQRVVTVSPTGPAARRRAQAAGLLRGVPLRVTAHQNVAMQRAVGEMVRGTRFDAVLVALAEAATFLPASVRLPCVLDLEDPPYDKLRRTLPWLDGRARLAARHDLRVLRRFEAALVRRFDRLVLVNPHDADAFGRTHRCADRVVAIRHAVEAGAPPLPETARVAHGMVVSGNMAHPPNVAAVEFVCRDVLPRVRAAVPDATLRLVGAHPTASVRAWGTIPGVTVTGEVADLRAEIAHAKVALCGVPVVVGAQTKVLEAMACGTPVVTTPAGNFGIDGVDGRDLHVADSADRFADRVADLLHGLHWQALSRAGRRLVEEQFAPARAASELETVLSEAMRVHRSRGAA